MNNPSTDFLVAFEDTGTGLVEKWRAPLGYCPFGSFGVGPDGSVYSYSRSLEVVRLDPATGAVLDASPSIPFDVVFMPRMAIDADGRVFLTNGGAASGRLYAFASDLTELWSQPVVGVNLGGPVLGRNGTLVVCGTGSVVRAYRSSTTDVVDAASSLAPLVLGAPAPNPFVSRSAIELEVRGFNPVRLEIIDARGRRIRTIHDDVLSPGRHAFEWDGRDDLGRDVPAGVYYYAANARAGQAISKLR
jgi:hypothetical protein